MKNEHATLDVNAASKPQLQRAIVAVAGERDRFRTEVDMLRRVLGALAAKHDRRALFGPDGLLVTATLDLPTVADSQLPELFTVDVVNEPGGTGRVVVSRVDPEPTPATPLIVAGDERPT